MLSPSTLYIVATPIGNLSDLSLRAIETLKAVDFVISEDARSTSKVLRHYAIQKEQLSYRDENKHKAIPKILEMLTAGLALALVTDSGTPLISDPGFKLVEAVVDAGFQVVPIPGPSAIIAALSASGVPTDKFTFVGFLHKKGGQRTQTIQTYGELDATMIIYESPHRVIKTLEDIGALLGTRYVCVARELTKIYETFYRGEVNDVLALLRAKPPKGEFVILVAKKGYKL